MKNLSGTRPVGDRILVKPDPVEEITKGNIVVPETVRNQLGNAQTVGTVVSVGADAYTHYKETGSDGLNVVRSYLEPWARVGDRVMFNRYAGKFFEGLDGELYVCMRDSDVNLIVDEKFTDNNIQSRKALAAQE